MYIFVPEWYYFSIFFHDSRGRWSTSSYKSCCKYNNRRCAQRLWTVSSLTMGSYYKKDVLRVAVTLVRKPVKRTWKLPQAAISTADWRMFIAIVSVEICYIWALENLIIVYVMAISNVGQFPVICTLFLMLPSTNIHMNMKIFIKISKME